MLFLLVLLHYIFGQDPYAGTGGVETQVTFNSLFNNYNVCYRQFYNETGFDLSNVDSLCPGSKIIMGCKPRSEDFFFAVGTIPNSEFDVETTSQTQARYINETDIYFYNEPGKGVGFSKISDITLGFQSCDVDADQPNERVCWRLDNMGETTTNGGGARCGTVGNLKNNLYEQYLFHDACDGLAEGAACTTNKDLCWGAGPYTCQSGRCKGSSTYRDCDAEVNQCQISLGCDPTTGECRIADKSAGTPCDDGDLCTTDEFCSTGVCGEGQPLICPAGNATEFGTCIAEQVCNPVDGECIPSFLPDGTICADDSEFTDDPPPGYDPCVVNSCRNGTCVIGNTRSCPSLDVCLFDGQCISEEGGCVFGQGGLYPTNVNCSIGSNLCATSGTCVDGVCTVSGELSCEPLDDCTLSAECITATGECVRVFKPVGVSCTDNDVCTDGDFCISGPGNGGGELESPTSICLPGEELECFALGECYEIERCDAGACPPSTPSPTTKPCAGVNKCFEYHCDGSGGCIQGGPVTPPVASFCETVLPCNPASGYSKAPVNEGLSCPHPSACVIDAVCQTGLCVPTVLDLVSPVCVAIQDAEDNAATGLFNFFE